MNKFLRKIEQQLDNFSIRRKLLILYVFCMIIPLVITDSLILGTVFESESKKNQHEMENIANAVQYTFFNEIDSAAKMGKSIITSKYIDDFLTKHYESELDYVSAYQDFFKDSLLEVGAGQNNLQITFYTDNSSIISGGQIRQVKKIEDEGWYRYMQEGDLSKGLVFTYDADNVIAYGRQRRILFFQRMNFYQKGNNLVLIEVDYSSIVRALEQMNYDRDVYICLDDMIMLGNGRHSSVGKNYERFTDKRKIGYKMDVDVYGAKLSINVMENKNGIGRAILRKAPFILLLILFNILLPLIMVSCINNSFSQRIQQLSDVFDGVEDEQLAEIYWPRGNDEITGLMLNYNRMARRVNSLIQIVYKNTIKEQEMMVARQNAELLALHSQINPHFLFNALESIRMHSIIKQEIETADMVEKLAIMQRQYVEWQSDEVQVEREMEFVEAYLSLQKYRFGDRLSYELDIEEDCKKDWIPKLSIVTFVENACIHGIEKKTTTGWLFVRASTDGDKLCLEIEDTGNGMEEDAVDELIQRMRNANIDMLKEKGRVGIVNACLRLKMISENEVEFDVDSEIGVGTLIQIKIPKKFTKGTEEIC